MLAAAYPFAGVLWTIAALFGFVIFLFLLFTVWADVFRRDDLSGWAKVIWLLLTVLFPVIGWRGMFMVGVLPALLVFYIRRNVPESPSWAPKTAGGNTIAILRSHWRLGIYAVVLMTALNFFGHGTTDL